MSSERSRLSALCRTGLIPALGAPQPSAPLSAPPRRRRRTAAAAAVAQVRSLQGILGGVVDPHAAYLLLRGIKTLRSTPTQSAPRPSLVAFRCAFNAAARPTNLHHTDSAGPPGRTHPGWPSPGLTRILTTAPDFDYGS
jgi:hypothetical protein